MKEAWIHASYVSAYIKIHTYCMMAETNKSEVPLSLVKCLFIWLYCPRSGQLTHLQKRNDHMLKHFFFIYFHWATLMAGTLMICCHIKPEAEFEVWTPTAYLGRDKNKWFFTYFHPRTTNHGSKRWFGVSGALNIWVFSFTVWFSTGVVWTTDEEKD